MSETLCVETPPHALLHRDTRSSNSAGREKLRTLVSGVAHGESCLVLPYWRHRHMRCAPRSKRMQKSSATTMKRRGILAAAGAAFAGIVAKQTAQRVSAATSDTNIT